MDTKDYLVIGALVAGVAIIWTAFDKIASAANKAGEAAADLVPQGVYDAIAGERAQVTASVILPNGDAVTFNKIVQQGGSLQYLGTDRYEFTYNGTRYRVQPPRRSDGYYIAVRA